jgi:hypothetical protein
MYPSLDLVQRTAYQRDDEMGSNRLSMERVLESAQRQNMAQRVRLSFLQQQISLQLRITEVRYPTLRFSA